MKSFNRVYEQRVRAERGLVWLDALFPQLLSADGTRLADGLDLDGTHLHPRYVPMLEHALNASL